MSYVKVENLNGVVNQLVIEDGEYTYFQSYKSIIARKGPGGVVLDPYYWDYSKTTSRHLYIFLGLHGDNKKKQVLDYVKSGRYRFENLNP